MMTIKPTYEELEQRISVLERENAEYLKVEQALRESEGRYRTLIDNMPIACFTFDSEGNFLSWNSAAEQMYGYPESEAVGGNAYDMIVTPAIRDATEKVIDRVFKGEFVIGSEWQDRDKDGKVGWRIGNSFPLLRTDGSVICGVNMNIDITDRINAEDSLKNANVELEQKIGERAEALNATNLQLGREIDQHKQTELKLRLSNWQWRSTFDAVGDNIFLLDLDSTILKCNEAMTKFLEKPFPEIIGSTCWELVHNTSEPIEGCPFVKMKLTLRRETLVLSMEDKWLEVIVDPVFDDNGVLKGAAHIITDITDRKTAELALKNSEERYRNLFENTGTATFLIEEDLIISQANSKCEELSGYSKEEIVGKMKTTDFVSPEDLERILDYHFKRREEAGGAPHEYEVNMIDRYGSVKTVFIQIGLIPETRQSIASIIDITPRKQAEKALFQSEERLSLAAKIGSLGMWEYRFDINRVYANAKFLKLTGFTSNILQDFTIELCIDKIHLNERKRIREEINALLMGKTKRLESEIRILNPEKGWIWLYSVVQVVERAKNGKPLRVIGFHQDITDRKHSEAERENLIKELENTLSEVKTLSGLLPICSSCKKIRDDKGYWNQIEVYIRDRSDADFSHSICPECAKKLYPDLDFNND